jgi:anti-sigma factor ChrR (cupin superfamily)
MATRGLMWDTPCVLPSSSEPNSAALRPPTVVLGGDLTWQPSPAPLVWRKRLYHAGSPEAGTVTSVVRYDAGARFHAHPHPGGEEILVLSGTFSDARGDFGPGSYMLNPEGFSHAPFSVDGCVLFVKLRQYAGLDREVVLTNIGTGTWQERAPGARSLTLYRSARYPEHVRITELAPGAELPPIALPEGEEIFVLRGELADEYGSYPAHSWLRFAPGAVHRPTSAGGCSLYVCSPAAAPA